MVLYMEKNALTIFIIFLSLSIGIVLGLKQLTLLFCQSILIKNNDLLLLSLYTYNIYSILQKFNITLKFIFTYLFYNFKLILSHKFRKINCYCNVELTLFLQRVLFNSIFQPTILSNGQYDIVLQFMNDCNCYKYVYRFIKRNIILKKVLKFLNLKYRIVIYINNVYYINNDKHK